MTCKYCKQGIPLQFGIHMGEFEMHSCERSDLELVPLDADKIVSETWHQPAARKDVPFTCEGSTKKPST